MTRTFVTARRFLVLKVEGSRVIRLAGRGKAKPTRSSQAFPNRYELRKYLGAQIDSAVKQGFEPIEAR